VGNRLEFDEIPSTQDEAIRRVREGAGAGLTVVARRQQHGRGRLEHAWSSPLGGLYLSMAVAEPKLESGLVPVAVGALLSEALRERYGLDTLLKWPNDVLVRTPGHPLRKLAGVLVDRVALPAVGSVLVVGIGVNVATVRLELPAPLSERVAILSELAGRTVDPAEVEPLATGAIAQVVGLLDSLEGRRTLWERCRGALYGVGRPVRVDGRDAGVIRDLAEDGALLVGRGAEIETIRSGEVEVEGTP
jgi:BirA family biotin operon repressor/biotin-[acetyl-CoA-carboxylase] ligase